VFALYDNNPSTIPISRFLIIFVLYFKKKGGSVMGLIYMSPVVLTLIIFALWNHLKDKNWNIHYFRKRTLIFFSMAIIFLSMCVFDCIAVVVYKLDIYKLPSIKGTISEIHTVEKPRGDSKIILNNEEYLVDVELLRGKNVLNNGFFYNNKNYRIYLTPIFRRVCDIIDLSNLENSKNINGIKH
jgi:hypothetical protein